MEEVMRILHHRIPPFIRIDFVHVSFSHSTKSKYICFELTCDKFNLNYYVRYLFQLTCNQLNCFPEKTLMKWILRINSSHGPKATMPFLKSVEVQWENRNCKYVYFVLCMYTYSFLLSFGNLGFISNIEDPNSILSFFFIAFQVSFPDRPDMKCALMQKQPFVLKRYLKFKSLNLQVNHSFIILSCSEKNINTGKRFRESHSRFY